MRSEVVGFTIAALALVGCPTMGRDTGAVTPEPPTEVVETPIEAEATEPTEEEPPPGPAVACREARTPQEEDEVCPWFDLCTLADLGGESRASFHAQIAWWHPVAGDRLVIALRTCRDPDTGHTRGIAPGDAPQELLEVTVPEEGDPVWRLLGRAMRGDMTCALSDDATEAACVAVHAQRSMLWAWLLGLEGDQTSVTHAHLLRESTEVIPELALRFHEDRFQVQLPGSEEGGELTWVPLLAPQP